MGPVTCILSCASASGYIFMLLSHVLYSDKCQIKKFFSMSKNVVPFLCCCKITAHCNCMTELEETCSYLAFIFFVEATMPLREAGHYPGSCILEIALSRESS